MRISDWSSDVCSSDLTPPTYNGAMTTLFISDLHLDPSRSEITRLFGDFLDGLAPGAEALYILGDLFEAWVGDDDPSETGAFMAERLKALSDSGVTVADRKSTGRKSSH